MIVIRLTQKGTKKKHLYRIVVAERRSKRNGSYCDVVGFYNKQKKEINIDKDKIDKWLKKGAKLTTAVKEIISQLK
ncbi:30S ribosomal protein S16 [Candidatus Woesebacteria bacterium RBG_13_34_9]|uniref:Small ribosomal subunit protein bS16 n=1 Tax=Candidatus Woesebacteria bacterium RBG_13_34_9 TaxID=1802477 RepID=A0A1F7X2C7_9BACT|nr:MAG: 30S ribosomal protein S16 [Candidatus Woesebacteria bacterium RBG_13_34_9]